MRKINGIILNRDEISAIVSVIRQKEPQRFLVFGLGNDSLFWWMINRRRTTVFIEGDRDWYELTLEKYPQLDIHLVGYSTNISQWQEMFGSPTAFDLELPTEVVEGNWDLILVDAPDGWQETSPGRMQSIAVASQLINLGGDVFVHDCDRWIEKAYSSEYLRNENLIHEVDRLRHYRISADLNRPEFQRQNENLSISDNLTN